MRTKIPPSPLQWLQVIREEPGNNFGILSSRTFDLLTPNSVRCSMGSPCVYYQLLHVLSIINSGWKQHLRTQKPYFSIISWYTWPFRPFHPKTDSPWVVHECDMVALESRWNEKHISAWKPFCYFHCPLSSMLDLWYKTLIG
jgi:hypothetical protein